MTLIAWLVANTGIDEETADRVASAFLPDGHSRLGLRAIKNFAIHGRWRIELSRSGEGSRATTMRCNARRENSR